MLGNWDQILMLLVGAAVGVHTGVTAWHLWRRAQRKAAAGVMCMGLAAFLLPLLLAALAH